MPAHEFTPPVMLLVGAVGAILILWLLLSLRGGGGRRRSGKGSADIVAAVQAERDVLRANHAVEVAELERKLAEAQARLQKGADATFRIKEMEQRLGTAAEDKRAAEAQLAGANEKIAALTTELGDLKGRDSDVPRLVEERDQARAEAARMSETAEDLRKELRETLDELSTAGTEREEDAATIEQLTGERNDARAALERERALADDLRSEAQSLRERLAEATHDTSGAATLQATIEQMREREAQAAKTASEQEATIAELREALAQARSETAKASETDFAELRRNLANLENRERAANEALSRLSYEHDGLKGRYEAAERLEREARAEAERQETLLDLRQQKIYALEARVRDQNQALQSATSRAEAAEQTSASLRAAREDGAAGDPDAEARIRALNDALDRSAEEQQRLQGELDALRAAGPSQSYEEAREIAETLSAAQAEVEELRAEVARLRDAGTRPSAPADVAALREAIRTLADRFMAETDPAADETSGEPTLAERIRAFKASRDAKVRRPLRIAAPKER